MPEHWTLYLDTTYEACPWPWGCTPWEGLGANELHDLPGAVDDLLRYSPSDGTADMAQVPRDMPREAPVCRTRLAVYHDPTWLYVFLDAQRPDDPIPELADSANEDFSVVIHLDGVARGLYFGMNQKGESIGCVQIWDPDLQPPGDEPAWPFTLLKSAPGTGPSASAAGILREGYQARVVATPSGLVGCFRIERRLIASGLHSNTLGLGAGRRCYATSELVSWGSSIIWSPRPDRMGQVRLVERPSTPALPHLYRIDACYDPAREAAEVVSTWQGPVNDAGLAALDRGTYAGYMRRATFALNGVEQTVDLAPRTRCTFAIPDGWNRLEVLTASVPPVALTFQKLTGNRLLPARMPDAMMPSLAELAEAFRAWHQRHESTYLGDGVWGQRDARVHCLCHDGVFHAEAYRVAMLAFGTEPAWLARVQETAERMLRAQRPAGWFPCHCSSTYSDGEPELGEGGAFTNGSVGEFLALAGRDLGDERLVDSARRAADYAWYRWEDNQNYAAFALWHLAALHRIDAGEEWLRKAVYYARHFAARDIGMSGAQDAHNYFTAYGNITLKGLACLLAELPADHPYRGELRDKTLRFANQILARQQPSGLFAGRNRKYLGYHHLVPGLFHVAAACPDQAPALAPALAAMARAAIALADTSPDTGLALALAGGATARYVSP